jgi:hypothetical protein
MRPIQEVLEIQNVNLILRTIGITIGFHQFEPTPVFGDEKLFKKVKLSTWFRTLLPVPVLLPPAVLPYLAELGKKNPAVAELLANWC